MPQAPQFDPVRYKETTREQWQNTAVAWNRWSPTLNRWLGEATEVLATMAAVKTGDRVLDLASGAGEPALTLARRVGSTGHVLATDVSSNLLGYAAAAAKAAGLSNFETRVLDGENLEQLSEASFDVVTSRVGLIFFPDQERALRGMLRVLKPGGRIAHMVYSTADKNKFFSVPVSIIRRRAALPSPLPGQPGPFSLGGPGVLSDLYKRAGFREINVRSVDSPLKMSSAAECVQFERESFGALHQMLSGLDDAGRNAAWGEVESELKKFEGPQGFVGQCEMVVGVAVK